MYVYLFDIEETPISENFKNLGYETRQFLYNTGSLSLVMMFFLPFLLVIGLIGLLPCKSAKNLKAKTKQYLFFKGVLSFLIESYMILCIAACIGQTNVSWKSGFSLRAFGSNLNLLLTGLFSLIVVAIPIVVAIVYYYYFVHIAYDKPTKYKYGKFIQDLNPRRRGRSVILLPVIGHLRKLMLAFSVVHLQNYPNFTIFSFNFQILTMIILIGQIEPFKHKSKARLETFNEVNLLLVNYHLTSLTDWVSDGDTRYIIGWSMIAVTVLGILVNMIVLAREQVADVWLSYKYWKHRAAVKQRVSELMEAKRKEEATQKLENEREDADELMR